MKPHSSLVDNSYIAKRVVLFALDGVRADIFYETLNDKNASFLRGISLTDGVWGVSHTRVPTETRPCLVAIGSGFYEDVSSALNGFKENPIDFDSFYNESDVAIGIGNGAKVFVKSAKNMKLFVNDSIYQNFDSKESYRLDEWVFNTTHKLLETTVKSDRILYEILHKNKLSFFLHLESLDDYGHGPGPHSEEYINHIQKLNNEIKNICYKFKQFYGDDKTAFILTSDHGMSEWKNHGDGDPLNTRTPFLAWGAGIRKALQNNDNKIKPVNLNNFNTPNNWNLSNIVRQDIEQINIAPLMSALIGVNFPMNSIGFLNENILNTSMSHKAKILYQNIRQLLEIYKSKEKIKNMYHFYIGYKLLENLEEM